MSHSRDPESAHQDSAQMTLDSSTHLTPQQAPFPQNHLHGRRIGEHTHDGALPRRGTMEGSRAYLESYNDLV